MLAVCLPLFAIAPDAAAQDSSTPSQTPPRPSGSNSEDGLPAAGQADARPRLSYFDLQQTQTGMYVRASGIYLEPQNNGTLLDGSGSVDAHDGYGLSVAVGYRDRSLPLAFEVEYAYRHFETDDYIDPTTMLLADNQVSLHTISANVLFDAPNLLGPVGVYAGVGIGVRLERFRFQSVTTGMNSGSTTEVQGSGFFWQAMGGATLALTPKAQLYGGVRWADAGQLEDDAMRIDVQTLEFEFGFRIFF